MFVHTSEMKRARGALLFHLFSLDRPHRRPTKHTSLIVLSPIRYALADLQYALLSPIPPRFPHNPSSPPVPAMSFSLLLCATTVLQPRSAGKGVVCTVMTKESKSNHNGLKLLCVRRYTVLPTPRVRSPVVQQWRKSGFHRWKGVPSIFPRSVKLLLHYDNERM